MDGEAGWWTTSGNIGLPPLARVMGVGRQQQHKIHVFSYIIINDLNGLPNSVGKVNTINAFKSLLEDHRKDTNFKFNFKGHV